MDDINGECAVLTINECVSKSCMRHFDCISCDILTYWSFIFMYIYIYIQIFYHVPVV